MSEGTAVTYVSRWAIDNDGTSGVLQQAAGLSDTRVVYRPTGRGPEEYQADNGRIELIYWGQVVGDVEPRAFSGVQQIKYKEEMDRDLHIVVVGADKDDNPAALEQRGGDLLGEVVKAFQENQPSSPGAHLTNVRAYVDGWDLEVGTRARGGTELPAIVVTITVRIQANVEQ